MSKNQIIGGILGLILGILLSFVIPPEGLSVEAMRGMGVIICAVTWLIFSVTAEYVIIMLMCAGWALFKVVPFSTAFATFSQSSWWLLIGALGIGVAVSKSGLLKRLSLYIMKIFPATFRGQVMALVTSGVIISPLIPSTTAKAAIVAPISQGISDAMGYPRKSRGAAGIFSAFYLGFSCTAPIFLSASFVSYMVIGFLPKEVQEQFSWFSWFLAMIPWGICVIAIGIWTIFTGYAPENNQQLPEGYVEEKIAELGAWSKEEKITISVVFVALLLWMTEVLHGIPASVVSLLALSILLICKVYDRQEFRANLGWDSVIFIGGIMNMGGVLSKLNVDKWIGVVLEPFVVNSISNAYIFIPGLVILIYLVRFIIVSWAATITIFILLLLPFAQSAGINPWVIGIVIYVSVNIWLVFYQNVLFLTSFHATGGEMVKHSQTIKLSIAYMIASLIGLIVSIPYWQWLGLIA